MREDQVKFLRLLRNFYDYILKRTFLFFILSIPIIIVVERIRFEPVAYIISFFICFGINFFMFFMIRETSEEFHVNR